MEKTIKSEKKPTQKQMYQELLDIPSVSEKEHLVKFINLKIDQLDKKNSTEKKPTKTQQENEVIKTAIFEGMEPNRMYTVTEIQKEISECNELTNQKISSLLRQMVESHQVERKEDKRKAYFQKVEG